jgi:hypothetical protein
MNVLTKNPIIVASNSYSNNSGPTPPSLPSSSSPSSSDVEKAKKEGFDWDKATGTWKKVQDSGVLDYIAGLVGRRNQQPVQTFSGGVTNQQPVMPVETRERGMSTGMKIGIAVGGVVLLGTIIYFATRKK